jgi:O-6-methylguanine DNA methyltransferase
VSEKGSNGRFLSVKIGSKLGNFDPEKVREFKSLRLRIGENRLVEEWWQPGNWFESSNLSASALKIIATMKTFKEKVLEVVKNIPVGGVLTYSQVAAHAGNKNASRAVGTIMAKNQDTNVPCHRVVKSDGTIGMYNGLRGKSKEAILRNEGVQFTTNGKVIVH